MIALVWLRSTRVLNFGQNLICIRRRFDTISPRSYSATSPTRSLGHSSPCHHRCRAIACRPLDWRSRCWSSWSQTCSRHATAIAPPPSTKNGAHSALQALYIETSAQPLFIESPLEEDTPQIFIYIHISESKRRV